MAVSGEDIGINHELCVFESTSLDSVPDIILGRGIEGVQIVDFSERLNTYDGTVAVKPKSEVVTPDQAAILADVFRGYHGVPYENEYIELAGSAVPLFADDRTDLESMFCSELCAEILKRWGFLPPIIPSNHYSPAELAINNLTGYADGITVL